MIRTLLLGIFFPFFMRQYICTLSTISIIYYLLHHFRQFSPFQLSSSNDQKQHKVSMNTLEEKRLIYNMNTIITKVIREFMIQLKKKVLMPVRLDSENQQWNYMTIRYFFQNIAPILLNFGTIKITGNAIFRYIGNCK